MLKMCESHLYNSPLAHLQSEVLVALAASGHIKTDCVGTVVSSAYLYLSPQSEVLVALGNVVMAADPEEGLQCLQIAVKLREDEVGTDGDVFEAAAIESTTSCRMWHRFGSVKLREDEVGLWGVGGRGIGDKDTPDTFGV